MINLQLLVVTLIYFRCRIIHYRRSNVCIFSFHHIPSVQTIYILDIARKINNGGFYSEPIHANIAECICI
ncbi:hypothetical protein NPIL_574401 [Nephila pilipes]|uniref:Uncharacterized protein n=1 Tax=Nephila pilipes TaxID=299642 RepID=A0A8X6NCQ7_NEPPI|nr:hypothetical protein NPIL_574401 [Nephila pilipes]